MKFLASVLVLASAALVSTSPVVERDDGTALLIHDLLRLNSAIETITTAANGYTGGAAAYGPIRESFIEVNRTNRVAYYDGMKIKPREWHPAYSSVSADKFKESIDDSNKIIAVVADPVQPVITRAVDALIAKKDLIEAAGLSQETADGLNLISYDHDTLSIIAVAPKLNPVTIPSAVAPVLHIDLDWRRGVAAFGGIPLAPLTGGQLAGSPVAPSN